MKHMRTLSEVNMGAVRYQRLVEGILSPAGISINGNNPWDIRIKNERFYRRAIKEGSLIEGLFVTEDWHNLGCFYDPTLMSWFQNFDRNWPKLREKYGNRFYRMWKYYLLSCAGIFRSRHMHVWQMVLSKGGSPEDTVRSDSSENIR